MPRPQTLPPLPLAYTLFFLWIEPISTLIGAYYAHILPTTYMALTWPSAAPIPLQPRETIALTQLANLYLAFALNEALVLRATSDRAVWRALLFGLLVADFGHLYSCRAVGVEVYWEFWRWNAIYWGNLGFVYVGASMRIAFLSGVGLGRRGDGKAKVR